LEVLIGVVSTPRLSTVNPKQWSSYAESFCQFHKLRGGADPGNRPQRRQSGGSGCAFANQFLGYPSSQLGDQADVKSVEGKSVVKSYQFIDASGRAMDKFVKGTTESIRRDVQGTADVSISLGDYSCVLHLDTHKVDACK
jgi:hypothetical protein